MKKIRFGVVGTNNITDWVIDEGRQDERFELTAVCSRTQERADEFANKHSIPHTFTSLEDMAKSPLIDAVYIATPNYVHAEQSILCMSIVGGGNVYRIDQRAFRHFFQRCKRMWNPIFAGKLVSSFLRA